MTKKTPKSESLEPISDSSILKKVRQLRGLSRHDASKLLNCSISTIKRREQPKCRISQREIDTFLNAYGVTKSDFMNLKLNQPVHIENLRPTRPFKIIEHNKLRRSYKKIITDEVSALIHLRKRLGVTKHEACKLCGFNRSAIGAIENGRITLNKKKIEHIVKSYGFKLSDYYSLINSQIDRIQAENLCIKKIQMMPDHKLETLTHLINGL